MSFMKNHLLFVMDFHFIQEISYMCDEFLDTKIIIIFSMKMLLLGVHIVMSNLIFN